MGSKKPIGMSAIDVPLLYVYVSVLVNYFKV